MPSGLESPGGQPDGQFAEEQPGCGGPDAELLKMLHRTRELIERSKLLIEESRRLIDWRRGRHGGGSGAGGGQEASMDPRLSIMRASEGA